MPQLAVCDPAQVREGVAAIESLSRPVRCRAIDAGDLPGLVDLLHEGFPLRSRDYWRRALAVLADREAPAAYPRFGYLLESDAAPVGVLLTLFMPPTAGGFGGLRCNFSSWYVRREHRAYAHVLVARLLRFTEVTHVNVSPAPHTWPVIEAQGFRRYSEGLFLSLPWLSRSAGWSVRRLRTDAAWIAALPEAAMLLDHAARGCIVLIAETPGEQRPFVFIRRRIKSSPRLAAQLIYCRDTAEFAQCAGSLGRRLLCEGLPLVLCDARGALQGLVGAFFRDYTPKYFRGPVAPPLNDLAFTELVLFGV